MPIGVVIVAFPVYVAIIASTQDAATIINGNMPLTPGDQTLENYCRTIFVGTAAHDPRAGRHHDAELAS